MSDMDVVFLVLALVGLGVGLISVPKHPPYWLAKACFISAAIVFAVRFSMWGSSTELPLLPRLAVLAIVGAVTLIGLSEGLRWIVKGERASSADVVPPPPPAHIADPLLASQITEMREIEQFLTKSQDNPPSFGNSEENIRRVFDLNALVSFNLKLLRRQFNPNFFSKEESSAIDNYFKDSIFLVDLDYVKVGADPVTNAATFSFVPGKVGGIKQPKTYLTALNQLKRYGLSVQLPIELKDKINELDKTLEKNMLILVDTINIQIKNDPNFVIYDQDNNSPYLASTTNLYWSKFIPLKPRADAIIGSIRKYLNIGG
jgi:hypothetical protein